MEDISNIRADNLYITGYVIDFPDEGESLLLRDKLVTVGDTKDQFHTYIAGEKLRQIAAKYYHESYNGNPANLWWIIADANNVLNPFEMDEWIGQSLLIPDFEKVKLLLPA